MPGDKVLIITNSGFRKHIVGAITLSVALPILPGSGRAMAYVHLDARNKPFSGAKVPNRVRQETA